jgi:hypothetical protein
MGLHRVKPVKAWKRAAAALLVALTVIGIVAATHTSSSSAVAGPPTQGYWLAGSDGGVLSYGTAQFHGSTAAVPLAKPIVGMVATPNKQGYWLVASDGGVFNGGDAKFLGSTGALHLNRPIVGMAATPDGGGYWLVASDGGVFSFGDAVFHGSTAALGLRNPIVGISATPDGGGYWLVASDGGIFSFGDALFHGSTGALGLQRPIVGMAATPDGGGYWLVGSDGGIFAFGDALFHGSTGGLQLNKPIVGMAASPDGQGYWLVGSDGGIFSFGDAQYQGSGGSLALAKPIVGMTASSSTATSNLISGGNAYCGTRGGAPTTSKLLVIWEENAGASSVYGSLRAPNLNSYIRSCGHATNYISLGHPSLPNYLEATSGLAYNSTPWTNDCEASSSGCQTGAANIFSQVGPSGWKGYAESMPTSCGPSDSGLYLPRHNPAVYYTDLGASCASNDIEIGTPSAGSLHSDIVNGTLPTFATITPNVDNDQHNGTLAQADAYLGSWIPQIVAGPDYQSGRLAIVIVYDEGAGSGTNSASTIAAVFMSPFIRPGTVVGTRFTHYSLLAAAEDIAGVPRLGNAASAANLRTAFGF